MPIETITEYVVVAVGETLTEAELCPVLHTKVVPPAAVSVADCPGQMLVGLAVAVTVPVVATDTVPAVVQPFASVTVTE